MRSPAASRAQSRAGEAVGLYAGCLHRRAGGVFFATYQGFVNPTSFTFFESALILAIVVLGGMGSTLGVVLAASC